MKPLSLFFFSLLLLSFFSANAQNDYPGSEDHPVLSRFSGATIGYYEEKDFNEYQIALADQSGYRKIDEWVTVEGKVTRIYYSIKGNKSIIEVYKNYQKAIADAGFTIMTEKLHPSKNVSNKVGGKTWLVTFYESNPFPPSKGIKLLQGSSTSGGSGYIAAMKDQPQGKLSVSLGMAQYSEDEVVVMCDIIEARKMQEGQVTADAAYMMREIQTKGKVALYINFDVNSVKVKPEGEGVISEIAQLLQLNPGLELYIVGHTDMQGAADYNLNLSQKRADEVMGKLVTEHGIAAKRLQSKGVGFFAPLSSNDTEQGRSINRRVELVRKK